MELWQLEDSTNLCGKGGKQDGRDTRKGASAKDGRKEEESGLHAKSSSSIAKINHSSLHSSSSFCDELLPRAWSLFVDAFIDFNIGGQVLGDGGKIVDPFVVEGDNGKRKESDMMDRVIWQKGENTDGGGDDCGKRIHMDAASSINVEGERYKDRLQSLKQVVTGAGERECERGRDVRIATSLPPASRLVAIGDLHGDLQKTRKAFNVAGLINEDDDWIGGDTVVVQVGDQLDRGGDELAVLYLLEKLRRQAQRAGGAVHVLNGNHELLNVQGRFRYSTLEGFTDFQRWATWQTLGQRLKSLCNCNVDAREFSRLLDRVPPSVPEYARARYAALHPGGPVSARFLANQPTVLIVGDTVFVHGGLLPKHVLYGVDRMNAEVREWISGSTERTDKRLRGPQFIHGRKSPVWSRHYAHWDQSKCDCGMLKEALSMIPGARRMVVGHTIQNGGINGACDNQVFRVDVGMSRGCFDVEPQVLDMRKDEQILILRSEQAPLVISQGKSDGHPDTPQVPKVDAKPIPPSLGLASILPHTTTPTPPEQH